jgi:tetratricopeptide (TPR) repeat protein
LQLREGALGGDHPDTLRSKLQLAYAQWEARSAGLDEAEQLSRSALDGMRRQHGREDPRTLTCQRILADVLTDQRRFTESERLYSNSVDAQSRVLGPEDRNTIFTLHRWACAQMWQGKWAQGDQRIREVVDISRRVLGPDDSITVMSEAVSGVYARLRGRYHEAETLLRAGVENCRRVLGPDHPYTYLALRWLGQCMVGQGRWPEKERCLAEALEGLRETLGEAHEAHREVLLSMEHLASLYRHQGKLDEAIDLYLSGTEACIRSRGVGHAFTGRFLSLLASTLREAGRLHEARTYVSQSIAARRQWAERDGVTALDLYRYAWPLLTCEFEDLRDPIAALPVSKRAVALFVESGRDTTCWGKAGYAHDALALAYYMTGDLENAIATQREAIGLLSPRKSLYRAMYETKLAFFLQQTGDNAAAQQILRSASDQVREKHGGRQAALVERITRLCMLLLSLEEYSAHEYLCGRLAAARRGKTPRGRRGIVGPVVELGSTLLKVDRFESARQLLGNCLEVQELALPQGAWRTAHTMSLLGASLTGLGRFDEAEPLLLNGYERIIGHTDVPTVCMDEALGRIIRLYEAQDRPEQAAKWRALRE